MREIIAKLLGWLPTWLGFVLIIAAGVTLVVAGIVLESAGYIAFGVASIVAAVIAWVDGATSRPRFTFDPKGFGGTVANVRDWVTLTVMGLFVVATLVAIFA